MPLRSHHIQLDPQYQFKGYHLYLNKAIHHDGTTALQLVTEHGELFTTATTFFDYLNCPEGHVFIMDNDQNEGVLDYLVKCNVISKPVLFHAKKKGDVPLCKLLI